MSGRRGVLVALALSVALTTGCGGGDSEADVAATVAGRKITAERVKLIAQRYLETPAGQENAQKLGEDEVERVVLGFEIKQIVLEQTAKEMGVKVSERPFEEAVAALFADQTYRDAYHKAGFSKEDVAAAERAGQLSKAIAEKMFPDVSISDEELRQLYAARAKAYEQSWHIAADIAVFTSADVARELRKRVLAGEPFDQVSSQLAAIQSGSVEVTPTSPLAPPVIEEVGRHQKGDVSEPLAAGSLYYVVRVNEREDFPPRTFEEVKPELTELTKEQRRNELFQDWFNKKLRGVRVSVDGRYGKWDAETGTVA